MQRKLRMIKEIEQMGYKGFEFSNIKEFKVFLNSKYFRKNEKALKYIWTTREVVEEAFYALKDVASKSFPKDVEIRLLDKLSENIIKVIFGLDIK